MPPAPRAPTPPAPAAAAPVARSAVSPAPADAGAVWPPPAPPLPVQPYAKAVPVVGPAPDAVPALAPAADPATAPAAASVTEPQPPAVSPSATVARKPVTGGIYAGIGGDLAYRKDIGVAAALSVDVAGELTWLRVGVSGHWQPSVALSDLGAERATSELRLAGDIGWHGVGRVRPALLGEAGVSFRSFTQGNLVVDRVPTPNLGVKASLGWAVRPGVVIEPWLSASADLGRVELQVEGSSKTAAVGGATGRAGVTIFAHFGP